MPFAIPPDANPPAVFVADQQVPIQRTAITAHELFAALAHAWGQIVGGPPSKEAILLMMAHTAFETGHWKKGAINYNLGNFKHFPGDGYAFHRMRTEEVDETGKKHWVTANFRAYPSLNVAAYDYLRLLYTKYGYAWPELLRGDVRGYAHKLRLGGYYSDTEAHYTSVLRGIYRKFKRDFQVEETPSGGLVLLNYSDTPEGIIAPPLSGFTKPLAIAALVSGMWLFSSRDPS